MSHRFDPRPPRSPRSPRLALLAILTTPLLACSGAALAPAAAAASADSAASASPGGSAASASAASAPPPVEKKPSGRVTTVEPGKESAPSMRAKITFNNPTAGPCRFVSYKLSWGASSSKEIKLDALTIPAGESRDRWLKVHPDDGEMSDLTEAKSHVEVQADCAHAEGASK